MKFDVEFRDEKEIFVANRYYSTRYLVFGETSMLTTDEIETKLNFNQAKSNSNSIHDNDLLLHLPNGQRDWRDS